MKIVFCDYKGKITVPEDFECEYCGECGYCPENDYDDDDE